MRPITGLNVPLAPNELESVRNSAERNLRHPRDEARFLIRQALGLAPSKLTEEMNSSTGGVSPDAGAAAVA
jgi:hypothetical protein